MFTFRKNGHFYERIGKKGEPICIDDEIPFEIPDNWEWTRIKNISEFVTKGTTPKGGKSAYQNQGIKFLRVENIGKNGEINLDNINYIKPEIHENFLKRSILNENDLLVSIAGALGRTAIVQKEHLPLNTNQAVSLIRWFNNELIFVPFIEKAINSPEIQKLLLKQTKVTAIPNLTLEIIRECLIPLPPLNEQKRIIVKLEDFLHLINEYGVNKEKLDKLNSEFPDKLRSSILQEAIQGKLVPQYHNDEPASELLEKIRDEKERLIKEKKIKRNKNESYIFKENNHFYEKIGKNNPICIDDELPFDIPDNWEWCKLENIIELISGRDLKKTQYNDLKKGIPYVTGASNIINGQLLINRWTDEPAVIAIKNDILLSCKGTIGKILILNENKVHIARQIMSIRLIDETLINKEYIVIFLMYYVTNLINIAKSMIPGISREDVLKINIPLPSLEEQKRIVERIDLLFEELNF